MVNELTLSKNGYKKYLNNKKTSYLFLYQKKIKNYYINVQYWDFNKLSDRTLKPSWCANVQFNTDKGITFNVDILDVTKISVKQIEEFFEKMNESEYVIKNE